MLWGKLDKMFSVFLPLLSVFLWCFLFSILIERVSQLEARQHCGLYLQENKNYIMVFWTGCLIWEITWRSFDVFNIKIFCQTFPIYEQYSFNLTIYYWWMIIVSRQWKRNETFSKNEWIENYIDNRTRKYLLILVGI